MWIAGKAFFSVFPRTSNATKAMRCSCSAQLHFLGANVSIKWNEIKHQTILHRPAPRAYHHASTRKVSVNRSSFGLAPKGGKLKLHSAPCIAFHPECSRRKVHAKCFQLVAVYGKHSLSLSLYLHFALVLSRFGNRPFAECRGTGRHTGKWGRGT